LPNTPVSFHKKKKKGFRAGPRECGAENRNLQPSKPGETEEKKCGEGVELRGVSQGRE